MSDLKITAWAEIYRMAAQAERRFDLAVESIEPLTHMKARFFGDCTPPTETHNCIIRLRVHQINRPTKALSWAKLVNVLAHELAHVWCFKVYGEHRHGRYFYGFKREILDYWRLQGWRGF